MRIAFDVDGTLIATDGRPRYDVIAVYQFFQRHGHTMIIWSGGGTDYAQMIADRLYLDPDAILPKRKERNAVDIAFDDMDVDLATVNIRV